MAGFFLGPLVFLIVRVVINDDFISPGADLVIALGAWMLIWWVSDATPIPVTALLPLIVFPAAGIMKISEATTPYANPSIFLFMGGFMIAIALEKHRLHERLAINLIRLTGTTGNGIILGFTLASGFMSMWISNTATALMMLPIAVSVIDLLKDKHQSIAEQQDKRKRNFALGVMLTIAYSANIGGMATIIGTPPNVVLSGFVKQFYDHDLSFLTWMTFGVPVAAVVLMSSYFIITRILFPNHLKKVEGSETLLQQKLMELGPMKKEEKSVLVVFSLTSFLWITQQLLNTAIGSEVFNDTNIAIGGGILMFITPIDFRKGVFLLEWDDTRRLPWGILLLFGGGICLAKGMEVTGIVTAIGDTISSQHHITLWLLLLLLIAMSIFLTEIMSNVALVTIFIPVVFGIAEGLGQNPILLAIPVTFAASCAFMLPISTPPNAIVFASGHIRVKDMVRAGLLLNVMAVVVLLGLSLLILQHLTL